MLIPLSRAGSGLQVATPPPGDHSRNSLSLQPLLAECACTLSLGGHNRKAGERICLLNGARDPASGPIMTWE